MCAAGRPAAGGARAAATYLSASTAAYQMTILRRIPAVINPKLLFALASMGHGDELVLADANFPSASVAKSTTLGEEIRIDGTSIPELLTAIMTLLPLDPVAKSGVRPLLAARGAPARLGSRTALTLPPLARARPRRSLWR